MILTEHEARRASPSIAADLRTEAERVLDAADTAGILLRATGGLAVWMRCPSARRPPLERTYKDLDVVGVAGQADRITDLLGDLGYTPDREFNSLHGHARLFFWDSVNSRQLDVFMERIRMSHELDLTGRVGIDERTISLADLLLTKLQVFELNEKDLKDAAALLADHEVGPAGIDDARIASVTGADWGWWRTATRTLESVDAYVERLDGFSGRDAVLRRTKELRDVMERAPKSVRWRLRARVGERVRWYELPEEIEG